MSIDKFDDTEDFGVDLNKIRLPSSEILTHFEEQLKKLTYDVLYDLSSMSIERDLSITVNELNVNTSLISIDDNQSTSLWLKNNINPTYRPQGKSDCFPINGRNAGIPQPPHYIKDERNGFPIIMIPDKYRHEKHLLLEISWLTIPYNGQRYYSPYKFQRDHKDKNVKDRNPVYYEINEQELLNNEIKLKLVCIRSLLKELENVQPLELYKPDSHYHQVNQPLGRMLTLRELIQKYQLQKSQMAFTLCRYYDSNRNVDNAIDRKTAPLTNEINQNNIQRLIETTVISNVMTEDKRRQRKITLENDETAETSTLQINRRTKRRNGGEITTIVSNKKCRGLSSEDEG